MMKVTFRTLCGKMYEFDVDPNSKICDISPNQVPEFTESSKFMYKGQYLDNSVPISSLNLQSGDFIVIYTPTTYQRRPKQPMNNINDFGCEVTSNTSPQLLDSEINPSLIFGDFKINGRRHITFPGATTRGGETRIIESPDHPSVQPLPDISRFGNARLTPSSSRVKFSEGDIVVDENELLLRPDCFFHIRQNLSSISPSSSSRSKKGYLRGQKPRQSSSSSNTTHGNGSSSNSSSSSSVPKTTTEIAGISKSLAVHQGLIEHIMQEIANDQQNSQSSLGEGEIDDDIDDDEIDDDDDDEIDDDNNDDDEIGDEDDERERAASSANVSEDVGRGDEESYQQQMQQIKQIQQYQLQQFQRQNGLIDISGADNITAENRQAIERLHQLTKLDIAIVVQVFLACDKDENTTASCLLSMMN